MNKDDKKYFEEEIREIKGHISSVGLDTKLVRSIVESISDHFIMIDKIKFKLKEWRSMFKIILDALVVVACAVWLVKSIRGLRK